MGSPLAPHFFFFSPPCTQTVKKFGRRHKRESSGSIQSWSRHGSHVAPKAADSVLNYCNSRCNVVAVWDMYTHTQKKRNTCGCGRGVLRLIQLFNVNFYSLLSHMPHIITRSNSDRTFHNDYQCLSIIRLTNYSNLYCHVKTLYLQVVWFSLSRTGVELKPYLLSHFLKVVDVTEIRGLWCDSELCAIMGWPMQ